MNENFPEDDGRDPGLGDLMYDGAAYDGTEYELDQFGERVGSDDMFEDEAAGDEIIVEETIVEGMDSADDDKKLEDSFGESINPDSNPHVSDQLEDPDLSEAAESDYSETESREAPADQAAEADKPEAA